MKYTIGICAYNEEANIGELLRRLTTNKTKNELKEIIVVASGCTDNTEKIAKSFKKVKLISEKERKGKPSALNKILQACKTEYLVMTDADCLVDKYAIDNLLKRFDKDVAGVGGKTLTVKTGSIFWDCVAKIRFNLFDRIAQKKGKDFIHLSGYLYAIRPKVVKSIPLGIINDDLYVGLKIKKSGKLCVYEPGAIVLVRHPTTFADYIKQRRRVLLGHHQINEVLGHKVSTNSPSDVIPAMLKELNINIFKWICVAVIGIVDRYANALAKRDSKQNKYNVKWEYVTSSKKLK